MKKSFGYYYSNGIKVAKQVFKNHKVNYVRYFLYLFASFLSSLVVFIKPLFSISGIRLARQSKKYGDLNLGSSFDSIVEPKTYWNFIITDVVVSLFILASVFGLGFLGFIIYSLIYAIAIAAGAGYDGITIITLLTLIPFAIAIIVVSINLTLTYSPKNYLLDKYGKTINATGLLQSSSETMNRKNRTTVFMIYFVSGLVTAVLLGAVGFLMGLALSDGHVTNSIIYLALALVALFASFIIVPIVILGRDIAMASFVDDVAVVEEKPDLAFFSDGKKVIERSPANREEWVAELFKDTSEDKNNKKESGGK